MAEGRCQALKIASAGCTIALSFSMLQLHRRARSERWKNGEKRVWARAGIYIMGYNMHRQAVTETASFNCRLVPVTSQAYYIKCLVSQPL